MSNSRILLINFKRNGDILLSSNFISSLKKKWPHHTISMLVYKEFEKVAKIIHGVDQVYTINRKEILSLNKNRLFSRAHSINSFMKNLGPIKAINWDIAINYSNDVVSSYLISHLSPKEFYGVRIGKKGNTQYANSASLYFNEINTSFDHTPFHFIEAYENLIDCHQQDQDSPKLISREENDRKALDNFSKIIDLSSQNAKLVGIQSKTSDISKDIELQTTTALISKLRGTGNEYVPILLIAPTIEDRTYAQELNNQFNGELFFVEFDFNAAPSVIKCLDFLITADTAIKHIGQLLNIPTVEISRGSSPFFKQGCYNDNSLIITSTVEKRIFRTGRPSCSDNPINQDDIFWCLEKLNGSNSDDLLSKGITVYQPTKDQNGVFFKAIKGEIDVNYDLSRIVSRIFCQKLFNNIDNITLYEYIGQTFDRDEILTWCNFQKEQLTLILKDLLATIRNLKVLREGKEESVNTFVQSLDKLLLNCSSKSLSAINVLKFRGRIESVESNHFEENLIQFEHRLYELKGDLQRLNTTLNKVLEFAKLTQKAQARELIDENFSFSN